MNTDKDIELNDADDTGICLNYIGNEDDDPVSDVDFTGTSVNHLDPDDTASDAMTVRGANHIDAQCEPDPAMMASPGSVSYQDPLGDVELGDMDDTGICLHYIDTDFDDPVSDVDFTGTSVNHLEADDDVATDAETAGRNRVRVNR